MTNWYVLYVLSYKKEQLIKYLNKYPDVEAFVPKYEYYRRVSKDYDIKPMFNGYIFVKSPMEQKDFNLLVAKMYREKEGLLKQLVYPDTSALKKEEIAMFDQLLDERYVVRMSQAYLQDKKAVVTEGPLKYFEDKISKVDKYNQVAYLSLLFMNREIKAGLKIIR